jgi:hypothetical protein
MRVPLSLSLPEIGLLLPELLAESCGKTSSAEPSCTLASGREEGTRGLVPNVAEVRRSLCMAARVFRELDIVKVQQ